MLHVFALYRFRQPFRHDGKVLTPEMCTEIDTKGQDKTTKRHHTENPVAGCAQTTQFTWVALQLPKPCIFRRFHGVSRETHPFEQLVRQVELLRCLVQDAHHEILCVLRVAERPKPLENFRRALGDTLVRTLHAWMESTKNKIFRTSQVFPKAHPV